MSFFGLFGHKKKHKKPVVLPPALAPAAPAGPVLDTPEQLAAKKAILDAENAAKHTVNVGHARDRAMYDANLYLRSKGLNPDDYAAQLNSEFDHIQNTIGADDDPTKAFGSNTIQSLLEGQRTQKYQQYKKEADSRFGAGFEKRDITTSLLDDTINSILGKQQTSAQQYLDRGKARGMYNEVGYNAGTNAINSALTAGRSEIGSIGNTVLDKYRGQADTVRDHAYDALGATDIGDNFSLDPYVSEYQGILNDAKNNAGGDLLGTLGNRNFFDLSNLTQQAGTAQGALNLRDTDVATALTERKRRNSMNRGIGSQGAF